MKVSAAPEDEGEPEQAPHASVAPSQGPGSEVIRRESVGLVFDRAVVGGEYIWNSPVCNA